MSDHVAQASGAGHGYVPGKACVVCGGVKGLTAFWPDYTQPCTWMRLCGSHRKWEEVRDTRTVEDINSQLASVEEKIRTVYMSMPPYAPKT